MGDRRGRYRRAVQRGATLVLAVAALLGVTPQETEVPPELQMALAVRVLEFDRARPPRSPGELTVTVVFQGRFRTSVAVEQEVAKALQGIEARGLRRTHLVAIDLDSEADLERALVESTPDLVYVAPLRAFALSTLTALTRKHSLLTFTGVPDYVDDGVAVGVAVEGGKPRLLVNLEAARAEGADLNSQLLSLSRLITTREGP